MAETAVAVQTLDVNGLRMQVATQGNGPLVLLCHGFPELWISWRAQLVALAAAGYRAVAPDMRGYGGTSAPDDATAYSQLHLVGDMVELVRALKETQAVIVGHDWGAPVAWNAALLRPDVFRAVVGMSVPFAPPGRVELLAALRQAAIDDFYLQYFQTPGLAEAELERDVGASIRRIHFSASGEGQALLRRPVFGAIEQGKGFLGHLIEPPRPPDWWDEADIAHYVAEFRRTGFRGGLNWYRNITRSWELLAPWRGQVIHQPAMFIAGASDDVLKFPSSKPQIDNFSKTLPGLRGCHILEGAGHWIQRERAMAVNALLIDFLNQL
ncbi:MAG: alpha/beta hydrolase [Hydrogenophaga sp.]|nr:alpha/beta hydrolase [Hydrogenophaga sp.]